ncbi:hypothetical protein CL614_05925 [archaeon]|nr:hypothetical protein [archaeon]
MSSDNREYAGTAVLSVYNKEGIVEFARALIEMGWMIVSSGGTYDAIKAGIPDAGIQLRDIAELVGGGKILGHRVVTLSRELHAGLLATHFAEDVAEMKELGIPYVGLVCCDMYPLEDAIAADGATMESVIDKTDIGGPTMLSSAAKGRRIVLCDAADRPTVIDWLKAGKPGEEEFLTYLAAKADFAVAQYRMHGARFHSQGIYNGFFGHQVAELPKGENGHQVPAALFATDSGDPLALDMFEVIDGSPPSYNNLTDMDRLLQTMTHAVAAFNAKDGAVPFIAIGVKHGNPCGASYGIDRLGVAKNVVTGDTRAIMGGLLMCNFDITGRIAEAMVTEGMSGDARQKFDGVIAPSFDGDAIKAFRRKGGRCRIIVNPALDNEYLLLDHSPRFRQVRGGFLLQPNYTHVLDFSASDVVVHGELNEFLEGDLVLAWAVGSTSNSNTITIVKNRMLIGNGVGQQDRVGACELAIKRATDAGHGDMLEGAVAYSDSFFPYPDGPEALAQAGVTAILTSSGSVKDDDVVRQFCIARNGAMVMAPDGEIRGFFNH